MLVLTLICIMAILFLLICLLGFQAALKQRRTLKATLAAIKEDSARVLPWRKPRVIGFTVHPGSRPINRKTFAGSHRPSGSTR
jgi:hypothetical protein